MTLVVQRDGLGQQVQERFRILTHYNPFANLLEILRAPLLGEIPDMHHYGMMAIFTILGYAVALPFYAKFRERIIYWL